MVLQRSKIDKARVKNDMPCSTENGDKSIEESCTVTTSFFHRNLSHSRWDLDFWKIIRAINGSSDLSTRIDNWRVYGARCIAIRINILSPTERQIERRTRACILIRFMFVSTAASTGSSVKNARFTVRLSREQVTRRLFGFVETGKTKRTRRQWHVLADPRAFPTCPPNDRNVNSRRIDGKYGQSSCQRQKIPVADAMD